MLLTVNRLTENIKNYLTILTSDIASKLAEGEMQHEYLFTSVMTSKHSVPLPTVKSIPT